MPFFAPVSLVGASPYNFKKALNVFWSSALAIAQGEVNGTNLNANRLFAMPYFEGAGGTVSDLAFVLSTVNAGISIRLGLYNSTVDANGILYPGSLLATANSTLASVGVNIVPITPTFLAGANLYWLTAMFSAVSTNIRVISGNLQWPILPKADITTAAQAFALWFIDQPGFPAQPDPFPVGATRSVTDNIAPSIFVRYSA